VKIELEQSDHDEIARRVVELLKPVLERKEEAQDRLFDIDGLAQYLSVTSGWIYDNKRSIPHAKLKGQLRFRKSEIDTWISKNRVPASSAFPGKLKAV
jgi:predicted DNA-binding transcriptional regulator AlpA